MSDSAKPNILLSVASLSNQLAREYVDPYSDKFSPQRFVEEPLLACLILRAYLKTTHLALIEFLQVSHSLRKQLGLGRLPHYSTLKKFADRSDVLQILDCMLLEIVQKNDAEAADVAMDSTELETASASAHYQTRTGHQRK